MCVCVCVCKRERERKRVCVKKKEQVNKDRLKKKTLKGNLFHCLHFSCTRNVVSLLSSAINAAMNKGCNLPIRGKE